MQGDTSSLRGNIADNASLVFNQKANGVFSGVISGTGALTKTGAGDLVLTSANTYSGGTTISGGVLRFTTDSNLGAPGGAIRVSGDQGRVGHDQRHADRHDH